MIIKVMGVVRGIVRPAVTIMFAAGLTYGFLDGKVSSEAYVATAGIAIGFWFNDRSKKAS